MEALCRGKDSGPGACLQMHTHFSMKSLCAPDWQGEAGFGSVQRTQKSACWRPELAFSQGSEFSTPAGGSNEDRKTEGSEMIRRLLSEPSSTSEVQESMKTRAAGLIY